MVEFYITVPFLMILFVGFMQVCLACYTREMISEVAREGTRYAIVHGSSCLDGSGNSCTATAASVQTHALATGWPNLGGGTTIPNATYPGGGVASCLSGSQAPGCPVQVQVTYTFPINIPFIRKSNLNLSSTSVMYIIQ